MAPGSEKIGSWAFKKIHDQEPLFHMPGSYGSWFILS